MKKILFFVVLFLAVCFNKLNAEPVEYACISIKSIDDLISNNVSCDAIIFFCEIAGRIISEAPVELETDESLSIIYFKEENPAVCDFFESQNVAICFHSFFTQEDVVNGLELELINEEKQLYKGEDYFLIFKEDYVIYSKNQTYCEYVLKNVKKTYTTNLGVDLANLEYSHEYIKDIVELQRTDPSKIKDNLSEIFPTFSNWFNKFVLLASYASDISGVEYGIGYEENLGLVVETKKYINPETELGVAILDVKNQISVEEASTLNPNAILSVMFKNVGITEEFDASVYSNFSKESFDEGFAKLIQNPKVVSFFPGLTAEGMNLKIYDLINSILIEADNSEAAIVDSKFDVLMLLDKYPAIFGKTTYASGFDVSKTIENDYNNFIELYNILIQATGKTPSSQFVYLMTSDNCELEIDNAAILSRVKKYFGKDYLHFMTDPYLQRYTIQTEVSDNVAYDYAAPTIIGMEELKGYKNENASNDFVVASMETMINNKTISVVSFSFDSILDFVLKQIIPEEAHDELNMLKNLYKAMNNKICYTNGFCEDSSIYERWVVGDGSLSIINFFLMMSMLDEEEHSQFFEYYQEDTPPQEYEEIEFIEETWDEAE